MRLFGRRRHEENVDSSKDRVAIAYREHLSEDEAID